MNRTVLLALFTFFGISPVYVIDGASYFFFNNLYRTRDEAQFCCNKYGMTLPMVNNEEENELLHNFLQLYQFSSAWLGVFVDAVNENVTRLMWNTAEPLNYTNWDTGSETAVNDVMNGTAGDNSLCAYGDVTNAFKWVVGTCTEKRAFGCEIASPAGMPLQSNLTDGNCPDLLKMTANHVHREGVAIVDGVAVAGTHALFKKEKIVSSMGSPLGQVTDIRSPSDCALHCLTTPECNDVIILNEQICILYKV